MSACRVCDAGPAGQRIHKCPNSSYYVAGSDPGAEYPDGEYPDQRQCGTCTAIRGELGPDWRLT